MEEGRESKIQKDSEVDGERVRVVTPSLKRITQQIK